jgi:serine/threonine protein kinase
MNDLEIDLMKKLLHMDPYQRYTARQAIEHDYFNLERAKDPEYADQEDSSVDASLTNQESTGQMISNKQRVLSSEIINQRQKQ